MAFKTTTIVNYLEHNFCGEGPNRDTAFTNMKKICEHMTSKNLNVGSIVSCRGDGNCLIRALLAYILYVRDPNIVFEILTRFCDDTNALSITSQRLTIDKIHDIVNGPIVETICSNIRSKIMNEWPYQGEWFYHMDDTAIDGLAVVLVLDLLDIDSVTIFALRPNVGKGEDYYKVVSCDKNKKIYNSASNHETLSMAYLITCYYTHYSCLLPTAI